MTTETGYLGSLTADESNRLSLFKSQLSQWRQQNPQLASVEDHFRSTRHNVGEPDDVLNLKFLRARQFDVDVSRKLFTDFIAWRKEFAGGVDAITPESISKELNSGKAFIFGKDFEGRPVLWIRSYLHKKRDSDPEEMKRMAVFMVEQLAKQLKPPIETATILCDMSRVKMENVDMGFLRFLADMVTTRYPESLGQALIMDAPWLFNATWRVISPWLDAKTQNKIKFGKRSEVDKFIPAQYLLPEFGGSAVYPNGLSNPLSK
ncbi:sec14 cytosolic factor family phosphatidylinositol transporter (predicted) [Planoprotostelium fungivorum]|uniref:Sec14 cytosolic factor family phosphatidylinositol transporter (Predicted) n=1 Tax=Planoprotostelium fungivorum TaxID=1890364 RepID=A0A2P6N9L4_9EUKA|nr:sec14 cytosolic factor family phosphatidylinositol transporter (predicted) [Planoprotostelium fungivorum]